MARRIFMMISAGGLFTVVAIWPFWPPVAWFLVPLVPYVLAGLYDMHFSRHNILHNYPVIGHLRYMLEFISPEIHQYFIESYEGGRPFNRQVRNLVYARSAEALETQPFGTQYDLTEAGYISARHSLLPKELDDDDCRVSVGGRECARPYSSSRLNISAMSFGALSHTAIEALSAGARIGNFALDTGEGGISQYHLAGEGHLIWEIGTGYFGCRTRDGRFDPGQFAEGAAQDAVRMIEVKLSQGAKPSHGGILPGAKVSGEIARVRGIPVGEDCISPPAHSVFSTPIGLLEFLQHLRELSQGRPVGFKLCIGRRSEFLSICRAILETGIVPDFITVDGAEGGTGAGPVEFTDRLGEPSNSAVAFVHSALRGIGARDRVVLIASGKVATGFDMVTKIALGADICNSARAMMFSLGCIQALRCHTNTCPTGVTTQDHVRAAAIDVGRKKWHVANFQRATVRSFLDLVGAMGVEHPDLLEPRLIFRQSSAGRPVQMDQDFGYMEDGALLERDVPGFIRADWQRATAGEFA